MGKRNDIVLILLAILLVGGGGYWIWQRNVADVPPAGSGPEAISGTEKRYESREHALSFSYPEHYLLVEKDASSSHHEILLVEDTEENRELFLGSGSGIAREGPIAITIDVHKNSSGQSAEDWARTSAASNLLLGDGLVASTTVDGREGIAYRWSGLYEAESAAVATQGRVYLFTATYIEPTDQTVRDFAGILVSARLD